MRWDFYLFLLYLIFCSPFSAVSSCRQQRSVDLITRSEWGALPSKKMLVNVTGPLSYVIIHHTVQPNQCTGEMCKLAIQAIQKYHFEIGFDDIGYTYLIGTDGLVYEGRGWGTVGAHTRHYNEISYGFAVLGNFNHDDPSDAALDSVQRLLEQGVQDNWLTHNYTLIGHSDVAKTMCPGSRLYAVISHWDHFGPVKP